MQDIDRRPADVGPARFPLDYYLPLLLNQPGLLTITPG